MNVEAIQFGRQFSVRKKRTADGMLDAASCGPCRVSPAGSKPSRPSKEPPVHIPSRARAVGAALIPQSVRGAQRFAVVVVHSEPATLASEMPDQVVSLKVSSRPEAAQVVAAFNVSARNSWAFVAHGHRRGKKEIGMLTVFTAGANPASVLDLPEVCTLVKNIDLSEANWFRDRWNNGVSRGKNQGTWAITVSLLEPSDIHGLKRTPAAA